MFADFWNLINILETKLKEASGQQQFNRNVEDLEVWLGDIEGQLMSEDYGKDLVSVQNLQKKHDMVENDVSTHNVCIHTQSY